MKKSEVIKGLKERKLQIQNDCVHAQKISQDKVDLLNEIFKSACGEYKGLKGVDFFYAVSAHNNSAYTSSAKIFPNAGIVKLSSIVDDEAFVKGEEIEVRETDEAVWQKGRFIAEFEGLYVVAGPTNTKHITIWKQCRKYHPLNAEIDELKEKAREKGINVEIKILN